MTEPTSYIEILCIYAHMDTGDIPFLKDIVTLAMVKHLMIWSFIIP